MSYSIRSTPYDILEKVSKEFQDEQEHGCWTWLVYQGRNIQEQRYLISTHGKILDLQTDRLVSQSKSGKQESLRANVVHEGGYRDGINVAKALLFSFVGRAPSNKLTHHVVYADKDRTNVNIYNVRWK
ncbi:MAG: hypothetical protein ACRCX2_20150 [Paraclostridium sp.]